MNQKFKFDQWTPFFYLAARLFLGAVFASSGFIKLTEPVENFLNNLQQYHVIPPVFLPLIAYTVPWIEFLSGSFLIVGYAPRLNALFLGMFSMGLATVIAASGLLVGADVDCGCFGEGGLSLTTRQTFLLDLVNTFFGVRLFFVRNHVLSIDSWLRK